MDVNTYAKYAEIRAVLGISAQELPDTQLSLDVYNEFLLQELSLISGTLYPDTVERDLAGQYDYLKSQSSLTANQQLLKSYIRSFAIYTVAALVVGTAPLLVPKTISDGKALLTRFSAESTFMTVQKEVIERKFDLKRKIQDLLGVTVTDKTYVRVVAPDTDIITNEAY
ncbi:MAG: hypothetical protein ACWGQW_24040, partial [bacterium]